MAHGSHYWIGDMKNNIKYLYAANRTEEFGTDLWNNFILPPYFQELEYGFQKKPIRFVGGRGSGKTALLRYLSFRTQFSPKRQEFPATVFNNIGFYFKAEMSYVTLFTGEGINERTWVNCFKYALCLILAEDLVEFFIRLIDEPHKYRDHGNIPKTILIHKISDFGSFSEDIRELHDDIRTKRIQLSTWLKNIEDSTLRPTFIEMEPFLSRIVASAKKEIPFLENSIFHVLIDEYENLLVYQQKVVNTLMKGSEPPFAFHVAMKKNGMTTTETLGVERIQEKNDYRTVNIETQIEENFDVFCAELFFFRLSADPEYKSHVPISIDDLKAIEKVTSRFDNDEYKKIVLNKMREILPGFSSEDVSRLCLNDQPTYKRWKDIISSGIANKERSFKAEDFYHPDYPEATIVSCSLMHQVSKTPSLLHEEFKKLVEGKPSRYKEWIHKYLNGTIFLLWFNSRKSNVNYAGFDVFLSLSKLNIRHFIELCHIALKKTKTISDKHLVIEQEAQALAAKEAANYFFEETKSSGIKGNHLYSLITTLGSIFQYSQQRYSQSEFERTHFAIENGTAHISADANELLQEAVKWSVLYAEEETKIKAERLTSFEYTLNPIYAPFFNISFRKGRKLDLSSRQAEVLLTGTEIEKQKLYKDFRMQWLGEDSTGQYTLLSDADDE